MATLTDGLSRTRLKPWSFRLRRFSVPEDALIRGTDDQTEQADLFDLEQLRCHARRLADRHRPAVGASRSRLLRQLDENAQTLAQVRRLLARASHASGDSTESAKWLMDNYYLIRDQIRMARRALPRRYSEGLPHLSDGPCAGLPRVYELVRELLLHLDGQLNQTSLHEFIAAYQSVAPLSLGELWAVPIMLRLAGIDNLSRAGMRTVWRQQDADKARRWAKQIRGLASAPPVRLRQVWNALIAAERPLTCGLIAALSKQLSNGSPTEILILDWLAKYLSERAESIENSLDQDARRQAADEAAVRNGISDLRALGGLDWKAFVEAESAVEQILRYDPAGVYPRMDFSTRDRYRHVVEVLARHSHASEQQVAERVLEHARAASGATATPERVPSTRGSRREKVIWHHVGYYLVDRGRALVEKSIGYRPDWRDRLSRFAAGRPFACYMGGAFIVWLLTFTAAAALMWRLGASSMIAVGPWTLLLVLLGGVAGHFAINFVNWLCTLIVAPRPVARLDFTKGIPAECRTLVAVPSILSGEREIRKLVENLELRYLANRDRNLLFALLTDFRDAPRERLPVDRRLLSLARSGIERLNRRYGRGHGGPFYLLHRPRTWNSRQGMWMGEERKRGKLAALNELIRSGSTHSYSLTVGDLAGLAGVRYVLTLDADTRLPPQAASTLVGCMAHPLNWPQLDPESRVVIEGYAILQPRVGAALADAARSRYSSLLANDVGIDPYTLQASDVYQDLFGRGSFIGKGIYDVRAFERALTGRFPPNRILSHDLIESCFARSGLVSDVELSETVPASPLADIGRHHRWARGDWQIAAWLWPRVPTPLGHTANPLDGLSRWKILDNLRRSLTPVFLFGLLVAGWFLTPRLAGAWTLVALTLGFTPLLASGLLSLCRKPPEKPWQLHVADQGRTLAKAFCAEALIWCLLPQIAYSHLDAIVRTLYRLHVSRRNLLEWTTASETENSSPKTCGNYHLAMWPCVLCACTLSLCLAMVHSQALPQALPLLVTWLAAPILAWWLSRPYGKKGPQLTEAQAHQFRRWARQTWHYFEETVTEQHNCLPPDNVQEYPQPTIAHRTSPTNIGMGLLAELAATDLGYLPPGLFLQHTERTLQTLGRLPRYRGHFFNWYDTDTLQPTEPRYVSSVDSGNLWGSLKVLDAGLKEMRRRPLVPQRFLEGLQDTLEVIESLHSRDAPSENRRFDESLAKLREDCSGQLSGGARRACRLLCRIRARAANLAAVSAGQSDAVRHWTGALVRQCAEIHRDIAQLAFWTRLPRNAADHERDERNGRRRRDNTHVRSIKTRRSPDNRAALPQHDGDGHEHSPSPSLVVQYATFGVSDDEYAPQSVANLPTRPKTAVSLSLDQAQTADGSQVSAADSDNHRASPSLAELSRLLDHLDRRCTLEQLPAAAGQAAEYIARLLETADDDATHTAGYSRSSLLAILRAAQRAKAAAREQLRQVALLRKLCRRYSTMDFSFLYHSERRLLAIGMSVERQCCDDSHYDLLASEARLTSFMAVSHGHLPLEHWIALERPITVSHDGPALMSWSGSMFEYLMPMLLVPSPRGTILDLSCRRAVKQQICYARERMIPWGISESSYSQTDGQGGYSYRAFGIPGLGLMRGLGDRMVVAPYASALAAMVLPEESRQNLERLEQAGYLSRLGFYDAIDYSSCGAAAPSCSKGTRPITRHLARLAPWRRRQPTQNDAPLGEPMACRTVMAHHSGMTLLAFANLLLDWPMPRRFLRTRVHAAFEVLLEERFPPAHSARRAGTRRRLAAYVRMTGVPAWRSGLRRMHDTNPRRKRGQLGMPSSLALPVSVGT